MFIPILFSVAVASSGDFPVCSDLFSEVDAAVENPSADVDAAKKKMYKIASDKRTEVLRFVRKSKEDMRKANEDELKKVDAAAKAAKSASPEARSNQRKERSALIARQKTDKKQLETTLSEKEKECHSYLAQRRDFYLAQFRERQRTAPPTGAGTKEKATNPELENEFDTIPKGPGIVLKPQ